MSKILYLIIIIVAITTLNGCNISEKGNKNTVAPSYQGNKTELAASTPTDTNSIKIAGNLQGKNSDLKITKITIPYTIYTKPAFFNGKLYVPVNEKPDSLNKILMYDIASQKSEFIFESSFSNSAINNLMVNDNWITWENSEDNGANDIIYAKNQRSNEQLNIGKNPKQIIKPNVPFLYGDYLAWVDVTAENKARIALYNLKTNEKEIISTLSDSGIYNNFPYINEDKLLWSDSKNGNGLYCFYDLKTKKTNCHQTSFKYPGYAKFVGNKIFGINFADYHIWRDQSFGYFDISNNNFVALDGQPINRFEISNHNLAVINQNQELKLYTINNQDIKETELPFNTKIDTIDFSMKGELIAGYTDINKRISILYLIQF